MGNKELNNSEERGYEQAIREVVELVPKTINNDRIITIGGVGGYDTLYVSADGECFLFNTKNEKNIRLAEATEDCLYGVFSFLDANKFNLETREVIREFESVEDKNWTKEPEEVRCGDEVIGLLGIPRLETVGDEELRSVVFLSPDGTYATLTMWGSGSEKEIGTAKADLLALGEAIKNYSEKL